MASRVDEDDQQELLNTEMTYFSEGDARGHGRHKRETHNSPGSADDCNTELLHLIYLGDVFEYTIPSFRFITVELQHAVICDITRSDAVRHYDIFLKFMERSSNNLTAPCSIQVMNSGYISVGKI